MKKIYDYLFYFCFIIIFVGFVAMFASHFALKLNFGMAVASSKEMLAGFFADEKLAYVKNGGEIALIDLKTGIETLINEKFGDIKSIAFNKSRSKLIIAGSYKNINGVYFYDFANKKASAIVCDKSSFYYSASCSSDGKSVCYTLSKKNDPFYFTDIRVYDLASKTEKNVTNQSETSEVLFYYNYVQFSHDAKALIYSRASISDIDTPRYDSIHICKLNLSNSSEEVLIGGSTAYDSQGAPSGFKASVPSLLENGNIGFLKTIGNVKKSFAIYDVSSGLITEALGEIENVALPKFSRNGKYIAFEMFNDEGQKHSFIQLYEISSRSHRKVAEGKLPVF